MNVPLMVAEALLILAAAYPIAMLATWVSDRKDRS